MSNLLTKFLSGDICQIHFLSGQLNSVMPTILVYFSLEMIVWEELWLLSSLLICLIFCKSDVTLSDLSK